MDEQTNACELTPEQEDTAQRLRRLFGQIVADRYVDFCRLAAGAVRLRVSQPHAAHSLRELDSMLRHVLAVPLDVKAIENPEDVAKLERAREALMAVGYEQAQVHEATKKLRPVLSHKVQIQKIVERLGLDRDADVARHWISVTNAAGKAHERSLHRSLAVDEDFRAQYLRPFDTAIRAIAIKLEGHYPALMLRVEALTECRSCGGRQCVRKRNPGSLAASAALFWKTHDRGLVAAFGEKGIARRAARCS